MEIQFPLILAQISGLSGAYYIQSGIFGNDFLRIAIKDTCKIRNAPFFKIRLNLRFSRHTVL